MFRVGISYLNTITKDLTTLMIIHFKILTIQRSYFLYLEFPTYPIYRSCIVLHDTKYMVVKQIKIIDYSFPYITKSTWVALLVNMKNNSFSWKTTFVFITFVIQFCFCFKSLKWLRMYVVCLYFLLRNYWSQWDLNSCKRMQSYKSENV